MFIRRYGRNAPSVFGRLAGALSAAAGLPSLDARPHRAWGASGPL